MKSSTILTRIGKYGRSGKGDKIEVVFSARAYASLLSEVLSEIQTETGGVFLGYYDNGIWQVVESVDPGPLSRFEVAYFEYDQKYVNHLINKVSRIYGRQLDLIGLWHRHPGSFDQFSSTDDGTNASYAQLNDVGAVSALVNIDPSFRLTVYHVTLDPLRYRKVRYAVLERENDEDQAAYADVDERIGQIEAASGRLARSFSGELASVLSSGDAQGSLRSYLARRSMANMANREFGSVDDWDEDDFGLVLAAIEPDVRFLESRGLELVAHVNSDRRLELQLTDGDASRHGFIEAIEPKGDGQILFAFDGQSYRYRPNLLREALEEGE
ncbi:Mov34/MPN/PAD-1 family protein [Arabiibacter massiliensis]|uniref:Mov34/MPN/PAD-1 family protein n=1 Tax=Arabiibacter massiliensis TaxID=1870985 RepID=UPI0009BA3023|nr:Mov34/MPN/PAD-1 family protein [Arabiibacter massiliensis]